MLMEPLRPDHYPITMAQDDEDIAVARTRRAMAAARPPIWLYASAAFVVGAALSVAVMQAQALYRACALWRPW